VGMAYTVDANWMEEMEALLLEGIGATEFWN
jgi:hypothetical protein